MKGSLLFAATTLGFVLVACSGAALDDDLGQADDELSAVKACQGKSCGDACTLCPPGKKNCFETAVLKQCNAKGKCGTSAPQCGGGAIDGGPAPYQPCAGKTCGQSCTLCAPNDPTCVETGVVKFCHSDGSCKDFAPACIPPPPPPPYNPCASKTCGQSCTLCAPNDPNCVETAVLKQCNAAGQCTANAPACKPAYNPCGGKTCGQTCSLCDPTDPNCVETAVLKFCHSDGVCKDYAPACIPPPPYSPCGGKACGQSCTLCDPTDPNCVETAVLKQCNASGQCTMNTPVCK
jgi:hypothetical protein